MLGGSEDKFCLAYGIFGLAAVAGARGEPGRAARLWGAAEALREEIGVVSLTQWELHAYDYEGRVSAARDMLGDEGAWEEAFAQGRAMSAEEAVEYALSEEVVPAAPEIRRLTGERRRSPHSSGGGGGGFGGTGAHKPPDASELTLHRSARWTLTCAKSSRSSGSDLGPRSRPGQTTNEQLSLSAIRRL